MTSQEILNSVPQNGAQNSQQYMNEYTKFMENLDKLKWNNEKGDEVNPYDPDGFFSSDHSQASREFATNSLNYLLANLQNNWNVSQWKRQVEWDSPANQVERYKAAGLSSAAAAQAVQGFASPQLESADLANQQTSQYSLNRMQNVLGALGQISDFAQVLSQLRKDNAESSILEQRAGMETERLLTDFDVKRQTLRDMVQRYDMMKQLFPYSQEIQKNSAEASKFLPHQAQYNAMSAEKNYDLLDQKYGFLKDMNEKELQSMTKDIEKKGQEILNLKKAIQEMNSRIELNRKLGKEAEARAELVEVQKETEKLNQAQIDLENTLIKYGNPKDPAGKMAAMLADEKISPEDLGKFFLNGRAYLLMGKDYYKSLPVLQNYFDEFVAPSENVERGLDQDLFNIIFSGASHTGSSIGSSILRR